MTRHLFPRAHLPHPHIASHLAAAFASALHHQKPAIVPDGHDWSGWHYPDGQGYTEVTDGQE